MKSAIMVIIGYVLGVFVMVATVKKTFVLIPKNDIPGYTFVADSITYQVRPLRTVRVLSWDGRADSVYRAREAAFYRKATGK